MLTDRHDGLFAFAPWQVTENADGCPEDRPWGVIDEDSGDVEGCHATETEAQAQVDALETETEADEGEPSEDGAASASERRVFAVWAVEGYDTGDGRLLEVGQGTWRNLPLAMMIMPTSTHGGYDPGQSIGGYGRWTHVERMGDGRRIYAEGVLDTSSKQGQEFERMIASGNLRFVSVDIGRADVYYDIREVDEEGWPIDVLARLSDYEIATATIVPIPAIDLAVVWLEGMDEPAELTAPLPDIPPVTGEPVVVDDGLPMDELVSSARDDEGLPPADWFEDPELDELTHLTVTPEGRVFGHLAPWGTCHIGMPGCVTAPEEPDYSHFCTGETLAWCDCDTGEHTLRIPTGVITLGTRHAERGISSRDAAWHYDHTGAAVADVAAGVDEIGIWMSGAVRPGVTEERIRELRAADVSGDWRTIGGRLRLVAALACCVAGFPIPRTPQAHLVASAGQLVQTSLVAPFGTPRAGRHSEDPRFVALRREIAELRSEMRRVRSIADPLQDQAAVALVASLRNTG